MTRACSQRVALGLLVLATACVPKAAKLPSSSEARSGPRTVGEAASVEPLLKPPTGGRSAQAEEGRVESAGYWHWDGVRYVWVPATSEDPNPAYLWGYRE